MQLSEQQQLAVQSWDRSTAIIASAGSGKTEVLTRRLLHLLEHKKAELNQILAITFTEKSASDLKRRLTKRLDPTQKEELPWAMIGTFSGFCLNILKEFAPAIGYSPSLSVWSETPATLCIFKHCRKTLLNALKNQEEAAILLIDELEYKPALHLLTDLMQFRWHAKKTFALATSPENEKEAKLREAVKNLFERALASYAQEKRDRQIFDFQDLEIFLLDLVTGNHEVRTNLQNRFKHILVDEVQDINDLQRQLIFEIFDPKKNTLCVVGDWMQSIYRFRGANVHGFKEMVDKIIKSGGHIVNLNENYRSRPGILKFVDHTFESLVSKENRASLLARVPEEERVPVSILQINSCTDPTSEEKRKIEAQAIAETILNLVQNEKKKYSDFCILFQTLSDVHYYSQALAQAKIPYRLHGGRGFLESQEVIDLLFILKIMNHPEDRLALVGLMRSPLLGFDDIVITELALRHPQDLGKKLFSLPQALWLKNIFEQRENRNPSEILEEALQQTGYEALLFALDPSGSKWANIEQLLSSIRELETSEEMSMEELVLYFDELKSSKAAIASASAVDLSFDCTQLMTIHAAKGLEFEVVILADIFRRAKNNTQGAFFSRSQGIGFRLHDKNQKDPKHQPTEQLEKILESEKEENIEEKKRLLYVALTRAKELLILPKHLHSKSKGDWEKYLDAAIAQFGPCTTLVYPFENSGEANAEAVQAGWNFIDLPTWDLQKRHFTVTDLERERKELPEKQKMIPTSRRLTGAQSGDLLHSVLKNFSSIEKACTEQEISATPKEKEDLQKLLHNFLQSDIAPPSWNGEHEVPFKLKSGGKIISGAIDYILETKEGWILYDFKTDAKPNPKKYQLQMDIYGLALVRACQKPIKETRLLFLRSEKATIQAWTPEREKKITDWLDQWTQKN